MKKLFTLLSTLLFITTPAHALYCVNTAAGYASIRASTLTGKNFAARVSCTRYAPAFLYWKGGIVCQGKSFYGRNYTCRVTSIRRR